MHTPEGEFLLLKKPRSNASDHEAGRVGRAGDPQLVEVARCRARHVRRLGYHAAEMAEQGLAEFEAEWSKKCPTIGLTWRRAWQSSPSSTVCVRPLIRHEFTKRSLNMTANWVFA
jgi:hypothetical protein